MLDLLDYPIFDGFNTLTRMNQLSKSSELL